MIQQLIYQQMVSIVMIANLISLLNWLAVLFSVSFKLARNPQNFSKEDITFEVHLLKFVQTMQLFDLVFIMTGKSKGSMISTMLQLLGRLIVVWVFVSPNTNHYAFALMSMMWSIADSTRYVYYLCKNGLTEALRYNLFLVLYPTGVYAEMWVINDYIKLNASTITLEQINFTRFIQGGIIVGMLYLFRYMLKMRAKHYKQDKKPLQKQEERNRSKSPKARRD